MILVTGSNGFVGRAVCSALARRGVAYRAAVRSARSAGEVAVGEIDARTDWQAALEGCDTVIHLAARVHMMHETAPDPLAAFRSVNVAGTRNLAEQAIRCGVRRIVFASSLKVNGEVGGFAPGDLPAPEDAYARSKHEAEELLWALSRASGLEAVILRPPLVYGPGVGANFARLLAAVARGLPLPLARIDNRRSLVYVGNLADALVCCASHPGAAGKTFLISDGEDVSTPELVRRLARAMARPTRLVPVPKTLLRLVAKGLGKSAAAERLLGSLYVAASGLQDELGWQPPHTMQEGLCATTNHFMKGNARA